MSATDPSRQVYDAALEAARRATAAAPDDPARLDAVFERIRLAREQETQVEKRRALRPWQLGLGGLATAAVAAALVVVLRAPAPSPTPLPVQETLTAQVMLYSGGVTTEATGGARPLDVTSPLEPRDHIVLPERARVDVAFGAVARMTVRGPAQFTISDEHQPVVAAGSAGFSVARRPEGQAFSLRAGDAEVVVHGTEFALVVQSGALRALTVREGIVEVRWPDRPQEPARFLHAGESLAPLDGDVVPSMFDFERPWWQLPSADGGGSLSVRSAPAGARVQIGGQLVGETPLTVRWPASAVALEVEHEGYETWSGRAEAERGKERIVDVTLTALPAEAATEEPAEVRRGPDPWKVARAALAKRNCGKVESVVHELVRQSANVDQRAQASVLIAECRLRKGEKARALQQFKVVVDRYPRAAPTEAALFEAGKLAMELGRGDEAERLLEQYRERHPHGRFIEAADFRRCELLIGQRHLDEAGECLQHFTGTYPSSRRTKEALFLLATIARGEKSWSNAEKLYVRYLELEQDPVRAEKAAFQRIQCLRQGSLPGLAEALAEYLARFPDGAHAADVKKWQR